MECHVWQTASENKELTVAPITTYHYIDFWNQLFSFPSLLCEKPISGARKENRLLGARPVGHKRYMCGVVNPKVDSK